MAQVKVAFKNILDKRATYKPIEKTFLSAAVMEYARLYCEDPDIYTLVMCEKVHIHLNRKYVKVDDWSSTILFDGDKILITPVVEGDLLGGGTLGIVLGAILIGVSAIFTGGATFAIAGVLFNQMLFLMGAAMMMGGLMSILMQPDLPTLSAGGFSGGKNSQTYSWQGISTQANPQTPVPVVYGKHLIGGNLISIFTERQGADDYLYMLIAMAEGEIAGICTEENTDSVCTTSDYEDTAYKHPYITLDDQPFQNYNNVEWWFRNGTNLPSAAAGEYDPTVQNIIPHFNGSRMQIDDGRPLNTTGVIYTTTKEVDMARIQIRFPSLYNAEGGSVRSSTVTYAVDFRVNGESDWQSIQAAKYVPVTTPQVNNRVTAPAQNFNIIYNTSVPGITQGGAFATTKEAPDSIFIECTDSVTVTPGTPDLNNLQDINVRNSEIITTLQYNVKNLTTNAMWTLRVRKFQPVSWDYRWSDREPYGWWITSGPFTTEGTRVDLGPFTITLPTGLSRGDSYIFSSTRTGEYWQTINAKSKTNFWDTTEINFHTASGGSGKAIYDIRVRRQSEMSDSFEISNNAVLNSVVEILFGDFIYPNTALLGMKIKATDQLSGSPPNFNILVKGMKVDVPSMAVGDETFEELFWDEDANRWELNGAERTWDNTTYINEYSNNSMSCLKDLLTNKVYGLGEYTNTGDFSDTNTIAIIKECHKEYVPTENDYTKWWGAGNTAEFVKSIEDGMGNNWERTLTINSGVPSVTYDSSYSHWLPFRLDSPLKSGQRYRFSITLSGTSHNVDIDIACQRTDWRTNQSYYYQIGDYTAPEIADKGDGTHTYDFTAPFTGIALMAINFKKAGRPANISGVITDISVNSIQGTEGNRAWHYHTYNGVLDTQQSALTALLEFSHSFRVWPSWYEGTFKFIMDKDEVPIHTISMSNTISFSQIFTPLSEIPYRIVGQFTDEDQKFDMTQIMIQSTDTNLPKSNKQTIGLKGITNRKRAERELKFKLTKFTNATHSINIRCGMDMIHATAGDIISVSNDLPQWGHGSRVASYNEGNKYIYLTEPYTFVDATPAIHLIKYQDTDNIFQTASIDVTGISDGDSVRRITTVAWPASPQVNGPLAMGVSTSYVKKFRLLSVTRTGEEEVEANAIEHIDTIYGSEPTLVVNQYFETRELVAAAGKPEAPTNISITQLLPTEGIGWDIYAEHGSMHSQEIIVELSQGSINPIGFQQIGTILAGQTAMRYINNELQGGVNYTIKLYAKNARGISKAIYQTMSLQKLQYNIAPPTGMVIKGSNALSQTWDGLDVTIAWNPIGQDWYRSGLMDFYTLNIYHTSFDPLNPGTNLLRTAYPKKTEYKYTYDMNVEDNGSVDLIKGTLIFVVRANLVNGYETDKSRPFRVANAAPGQPQNFISKVSLRTITFQWSPSADSDFKAYRYRSHLKGNVGTPISTWSSWEDTTGNSLARIVNGTEIGVYGQQTRAFAEVKTVDIYNSSSTIASGNNVTEQLGVTLGTQTVASWNIATDAVEAIKVRANAISALKINVATLSAITANMGVLTAGVAKSADGRLLVDFNNKFIKIFDAASTLRVQLGSIP